MKNGMHRRDFFKALGAGGAATAVLAGCEKPEKLIPLLTPPNNIEFIPGQPLEYATTCQECPAACGMVITTREGRAIKAEGNPDHPINLGTLCVRGQASMQTLYNPARIPSAMIRNGQDFKAADWNEVETAVAAVLKKADKGGVAYVTNNRSGTRMGLIDKWLAALGAPDKVVLEPLSQQTMKEANQRSFGRAELPVFQMDKAVLVVNFGAEFLESWHSPVRQSREFVAMHAINEKTRTKGRYVHVSPHVTLTGANADNWVKIAPGSEAIVALALANEVLKHGGRGGDAGLRGFLSAFTLEAAAQASGAQAKVLGELAQEFAQANPGLALAGGNVNATEAGTQTQIAVNILNYVAGNVGKTVVFGAENRIDLASPFSKVMALVERMRAGKVKVLVLDGANPLYSLPKSAKVAEAMAKVETIVSLSSLWDESTRLAHYVLPSLSPYESWGDANPQKGIKSLMQPVMAPVFPVKAAEDTLLSLGSKLGLRGFEKLTSYQDYLKNAWRPLAGGNFDDFWRAALQKGGVFTAGGKSDVRLNGGVARESFKAPQFKGDGLVLIPANSMRHRDGSNARNPWLQEIPDPLSQVVWDSWADINPETAKKLGIHHGQQIRVKSPYAEVVTSAYYHYGIHEGAIAIPMGQGHENSGVRSADGYGVNVMDLLPLTVDKSSGELALVTTRVSLEVTGDPSFLVQADGNPRQDDREIIQTMTLDQYRRGERKLPEEHERKDDFYVLNQGLPAGYHQTYRWGMVVDVDRCTGCSACVAACYAENNLPVVGKERMFLGREMAWIRIERFMEGKDEEYETLMQPTMCQHCSNAGCEPVCPMLATYHNPDGLNVQVYNRCVGTRYCSNNCPYKQRRFNWFDYDFDAPLHLQLNPDVTARSRGVMEKCSFCTHRIFRARSKANDQGRDLRDGEVTPACAQTCPTQAIVFGNLADPASRVSKLALRGPKQDMVPAGNEQAEHLRVRQYEMLSELRTLPAVTYLKKVTHKYSKEA